MSEWPDLDERETEITDPAQELHRQIKRREQLRDGQVTRDVFMSGDRKVSTYQGSVVSPAEAHRRHTEDFGLQTIGSCTVSVADVHDSEPGTRVVDDTRMPDSHDAHAYIDMRGLGRSSRDRVARHLKAAARDRIWQPSNGSSNPDLSESK